jgi:hypothetical protein
MRSLYYYYAKMAARRRRHGWRFAYMLPGLHTGDPLHWPGMQAYLDTRTFSEFIRHPRLYADPGAAPPVNMVSEDGRIIVDHIGRLGRLAEDFAALATTIGVPGARLARINTSQASAADDEITADDRAYLSSRFTADIAVLDG